MEELEKNETSTQAEENTVSLASAQALADALAKIEAYTPTTWVDNSSPDIDAEHLNKPEQAIKRVTDALNSAVDVIKDLQSQVTKNSGDISDVNNNLSKLGNLRFLAANSFSDAWNKAEAGIPYFVDITGNTDAPTATANRWFGQMWKNDTGRYGWQIAWSFDGSIYKRERNNSAAWTDWETNATKSDLSNRASYTGNVTDLDSAPTTIILRTSTDPTGYPTNLGGNSCLAFQLNPGTRYSAQLAFSFSKDRLAIRRKSNSDTWTAWKYVDFTIS